MTARFGRYELKKGDVNFLEGRVFCYGHLAPYALGPEYPALYFLSRLEDVFPYVSRRIIETGLFDVKTGSAIGGIHIISAFLAGRSFHFLGSEAILDDFEDIPKINGDVLYAGDLEDISDAGFTLNDAIKSYMELYLEQLDSYEDAEDYHDTKFSRKLWRYVNNLGKAVEEGSEEGDRSVRRRELELERFLRNSSFSRNVWHLINCVKKNSGNRGLINAFVELVGASHYGDAEKILEKKRKLEGLLK